MTRIAALASITDREIKTTNTAQGFGETATGDRQTNENSEGPALASDGTERNGGDLGRFRKGRLSLVERGAKSREETPKEGPRPDDAIAGTKLRIRDAGGPAHDGDRPDEAQIAIAIAPTEAPKKPPMSSPAITTPPVTGLRRRLTRWREGRRGSGPGRP